MADDLKKRQAKMAARDKAAGIQPKKVRLAQNEVRVLKSVSAALMLNQSETIVSLVYEKAQQLGLQTTGDIPEVKTLHLRKTPEALAALKAIADELKRSPSYIIETALVELAKSLNIKY